ncbi:MAG: hypothetical protein M3460_30400 [Actinomycetota bacterium]|jgi:hypothetical protein|nr:hypothetical protein [Actinomycetota bacterium]
MPRKGKRSGGKDLTLGDRSIRLISSLLQPLTHRNWHEISIREGCRQLTPQHLGILRNDEGRGSPFG